MLPLKNCVLRRPLHRMIDPAYLSNGSQTGIRDFPRLISLFTGWSSPVIKREVLKTPVGHVGIGGVVHELRMKQAYSPALKCEGMYSQIRDLGTFVENGINHE